MSQYSRNERNANAGLVVGITPDDYPEHVLAGIDLQRKWESKAFEAGGRTYKAPGQRVGDFLERRPSTELGAVTPSYRPRRAPDRSVRLPAGLRGRGDPRGHPCVRPADPGLCDGGCDADGRGDADPRRRSASSAVPISKARTPGGFIPRAKARALPAESFRRPSMASRSRKRSRARLRIGPRRRRRPGSRFRRLGRRPKQLARARIDARCPRPAKRLSGHPIAGE